MKLFAKICFAALILAGSAGCAVEELRAPRDAMATVRLNFSADRWQTRAFTNDPASHSVDRILVLPFVKTGTSTSYSDEDYVPVESQIVQLDIEEFPVENLALKLLRGSTYKVVILGYNSGDYDHNDPDNPNNKFTVQDTDQSGDPPSLNTCSIEFNEISGQYEFCEIFSGVATTSDEAETFVADDNTVVGSVLKRLPGGFSVAITDVPAEVSSMTLRCDAYTTGVFIGRGGAQSSESSSSEGPTFVLATQTPSAGTVVFDRYLLERTSSPTHFAIEIQYSDGKVATYSVRATDNTGQAFDAFQINHNQALNLSGSYNNIDVGFVMNPDGGIDLDDEEWDGYH